MKRARIASELDADTAPTVRSAVREDRRYLEQQLGVARAGLTHALAGLRHGLPRLIDPRAWVRHYPVAAPAVLVGAVFVAGAALGRSVGRPQDVSAQAPGTQVDECGERAVRVDWTRRSRSVCTDILRSAGRTLAVAALVDLFRGGRS
jgi:hypothetical protein